MEDAPQEIFRVTPGQEVRLKRQHIVNVRAAKKDGTVRLPGICAEYDPNTQRYAGR